jgi:hypothetical protein
MVNACVALAGQGATAVRSSSSLDRDHLLAVQLEVHLVILVLALQVALAVQRWVLLAWAVLASQPQVLKVSMILLVATLMQLKMKQLGVAQASRPVVPRRWCSVRLPAEWFAAKVAFAQAMGHATQHSRGATVCQDSLEKCARANTVLASWKVDRTALGMAYAKWVSASVRQAGA